MPSWFPEGTKPQVILRLDPDVLDWFKGCGWQTCISRSCAYMQAHERQIDEGGS